LGNGISLKTRTEEWLNEIWMKLRTRREVHDLVTYEYEKGNLTKAEYLRLTKRVQTSMR